MIHISNSMADEIILVTDQLRRMAFAMNDDRSCNAKRRAKLVVRYLEKKRNEKEKKVKGDCDALGMSW